MEKYKGLSESKKTV